MRMLVNSCLFVPSGRNGPRETCLRFVFSLYVLHMDEKVTVSWKSKLRTWIVNNDIILHTQRPAQTTT